MLTLIEETVCILAPPPNKTNVPSMLLSSSPYLTAVAFSKVTFSEPAIILADNFRLVSSAVTSVKNTPPT